MRLYANGKVSNGEESEFVLSDLCFATDSCNDPTIPDEDCLILSGQTCKGSVEGNNWDCRWKGIDVLYGDGIEYSASEVLEIIKAKNMRLRNCEGYIEFVGEADIKVDSVKLVDNESEIEIPESLLEEEIGFML